jgi:hypothetical protein
LAGQVGGPLGLQLSTSVGKDSLLSPLSLYWPSHRPSPPNLDGATQLLPNAFSHGDCPPTFDLVLHLAKIRRHLTNPSRLFLLSPRDSGNIDAKMKRGGRRVRLSTFETAHEVTRVYDSAAWRFDYPRKDMIFRCADAEMLAN